MKKHEFNIFPEMQADDYNRLLNDLKANGYDTSQPIYTFEGQIIDGWNRQKACDELGIAPSYRVFAGSKSDAILFIMRTNKRRNLTSSQWAAIAAEADEIWDVVQKQVEEERRKKLEGNNNASKEKTTQQLIVASSSAKVSNRNVTQSRIAETFNTNRTYVSEAKKLRDEKPDVFEQVKSGVKTIAEVKKQEKIEVRAKEIEATKQKIEQENTVITDKFDVIVIDPPWAYGREYDPENSRVANPYPEMSQEQLKVLELPEKQSCVVFLWATHAFIQDAFELLKCWGYKYKAIITWDKDMMGMGANLRMQCEFCLLATKGNPTLLNRENERDIIREKRREHSRKPEEFYAKVERMTIGSKIDYFSRQKRENWFHYGAETGKF